MENKYYLAVIPQPNNYFPINLTDISISKGYNTYNLEELDKFTLNYTISELKETIKEANLLEMNDDTKLAIIYYEKSLVRSIPVLTKDINFDMWTNIKDNFTDKNYRNQIYTFLKNKTNMEIEDLKTTNDINKFITIINKLPYSLERKLYFYLYER